MLRTDITSHRIFIQTQGPPVIVLSINAEHHSAYLKSQRILCKISLRFHSFNLLITIFTNKPDEKAEKDDPQDEAGVPYMVLPNQGQPKNMNMMQSQVVLKRKEEKS